MPGETEADRILRQRKLERSLQERAELEEAIKQERARILEDYLKGGPMTTDIPLRFSWIEKLIPDVLRLLTDSGYPDMEERQIVEEKRFGKTTVHSKAAWRLGEYRESKDTGSNLLEGSFTVYLLSDGRLESMYKARSLKEIKEWHGQIERLKRDGGYLAAAEYMKRFTEITLNGLRDLKVKLEAMPKK